MRTGGDGGTGSAGGNRHRAKYNAAQFINTLGLVAPLGANGEIDMPAEASERASKRAGPVISLNGNVRTKRPAQNVRRNLRENCGITKRGKTSIVP